MHRSIRALASVALGALLASPVRADFNCNAGVEFHPDGAIKACSLNGVHTLTLPTGAVVRCADGARAEQYPDGRLLRCTLDGAVRIAGVTCPAGAPVEFDPEGRLRHCGDR